MLQKINRKSSQNQKGFSLIELMVAVAILALASFGIFQAFSVGFIGMNESKARTIATNYVQEKMEELKNKDFDEVVNELPETKNSGGIEFTRYINVEYIDGTTNLVTAVSTNIKRITNTVSWNIHGKNQSIQSQLVIQNTQFTPGNAGKIVLYADPYNVVLPENDSTDIIAVIKDVDGNTITDWSGSNVTFNVISGSEYGTLSDYSVTPVNGIARVTFSSSGANVGPTGATTIIEAEVTREDLTVLSNTINIDVTWGAVEIELSASPTSIKADGESTTTLTAKILNAGGALETEEVYDVTFSVTGEGILLGDTTVSTSTTDLEGNTVGTGIATIELQSTETPGIASVTATSPGLFSDSYDIRTSGIPAGISIEAIPSQFYSNYNSTITVYIVDSNGVPVIPEEGSPITVTLNNPVSGSLADNTLVFDNESSLTTVYYPPTGIDSEINVEIVATTNGWTR